MSDHPLLWRLVDGKPGHENQSLALAENMELLASFRRAEYAPDAWPRDPGADGVPALVMGAGHRTHAALLRVAQRFSCPAVVLMKPSFRLGRFDLCLAPEHDFPGETPANVLLTRGMLNRLPVEIPPKESRGLFLIGGPSKHHRWEAAPLREALGVLTTAHPDLDWHLTDSRRTPAGFLGELADLPATLHPCTETGPDWLPAQLIAARDVWVTEDSMSMVYEALTARSRVGLLPMPRRSARSRVVRGIDRLISEGWVTPFTGADPEPALPPAPLHEASRCARKVIRRFFPALSVSPA